MTSNQLKLIAMVLMTLDHIGVELFPQFKILRIVGRLAFPIFAYMIAEGCVYTKNRKKYILTVVAVALVCQIVYLVAMRSLYMCIMVTFALSIGLIYVIDFARNKKTLWAWCIAVLSLFAVFFVSYIVPTRLHIRDFEIDYGFVGILVPVVIYFGRDKWQKIFLAAVSLLALSYVSGGIQWYCLLAVPVLMLYNGKRGKMKMKYLFYFYYPLHLVAIHFLSYVI